MPSLLRATLMTLALLALAACTSKPVLNAQTDIPATVQVSQQQVKQAILNALAKREWSVQQVDPQRVQAQITVRNQYHAEIDIRYNRTHYAIAYRDSRNLGFKNGQIHRNYNRWVSMLDRDIMQGLRAFSAHNAGTAAQY